MNRLINIATVSTLVIATALAVGPASAQAQARAITCGDTVTTDLKLTSDLLNCPNNGLVIAADDITLDLNGHTIDGDGAPVAACAQDDTCDVGVDNSAGHSGVEVHGGSVRQFGVGLLALRGASHSRLQHLTVANNTNFGIIVVEASHSVMTSNSLSNNGTSGLVLSNSRRCLVASNSVSGSHGYGIVISDNVDSSRITNNNLRGNDHGILIGSGSSHNNVQSNAVSHSGGSSIDIGGPVSPTANRILGNRLRDNGDGIVLGNSAGTLIKGNVITGTGYYGFTDAGGFGIIVDGSHDNTFRHNVVTGGRGPAIWLTSLEWPTAPSGNVLTRNVFNSRVSDGILVDPSASRTLIQRNTANGNGDDGIDVDAAGVTVTSNTANRNYDLGIEAVVGVTDGGGNKASGNGDPRQCTHIDCTPGSTQH